VAQGGLLFDLSAAFNQMEGTNMTRNFIYQPPKKKPSPASGPGRAFPIFSLTMMRWQVRDRFIAYSRSEGKPPNLSPEVVDVVSLIKEARP
jgi:hypothetical protein